MGMWRSYVCVVGENDTVREPPEEVLAVVVIGGVAYLSRHPLDDRGNPEPESDDHRIHVPARALMHALQAAIQADEDEKLIGTMRRLGEDYRLRAGGSP